MAVCSHFTGFIASILVSCSRLARFAHSPEEKFREGSVTKEEIIPRRPSPDEDIAVLERIALRICFVLATDGVSFAREAMY